MARGWHTVWAASPTRTPPATRAKANCRRPVSPTVAPAATHLSPGQSESSAAAAGSAGADDDLARLLPCAAQRGLKLCLVLVRERGLEDVAAGPFELFRDLVQRDVPHQNEQHGASRFCVDGKLPDLRASTFLGNDFFYEIVLNGAMNDAGLAAFGSVLSKDDVTAIRACLIQRANEDKRAQVTR